jgi:hypothetical protein
MIHGTIVAVDTIHGVNMDVFFCKYKNRKNNPHNRRKMYPIIYYKGIYHLGNPFISRYRIKEKFAESTLC